MKELLGLRIKEIAINNDNTILKVVVWDEFEYVVCSQNEPGAFKCAGSVGSFWKKAEYKEYLYLVTGDCCNNVWFNDILGAKDILCDKYDHTGIVQGIRIRPVTPVFEGTVDCLEALGYTLEGVRGRCDVIFRNAHNGYYGASCDLMTEEKKSFPCFKDRFVFTSVEEDWTA